MINEVGRREGLFGDMGKVSMHDFSTANRSEEDRVNAVTTVASIFFQNDKAIGSDSLYDKLKAESIGLPSSSFEFVPVLLSVQEAFAIGEILASKGKGGMVHTSRFGRLITAGTDKAYVLTNLRALIEDSKNSGGEVPLDIFNTSKEEIEVIRSNFFVFNSHIDIVTARQFLRHRVSWQELSRRYVSGKKVPFSVYLTDDMLSRDIKIEVGDALDWAKPLVEDDYEDVNVSASDIVTLCLKMYDAAIENGVKPQDARRIIPQGAMTQMWSGWFPDQLENMVQLRTAAKAQWEIRQLSRAMGELAGLL